LLRQPAFNAGFWDEAKDVVPVHQDFVPKDSFGDDDYIVAPSASCVGFVRNYYSKLFDNLPFIMCQGTLKTHL
jgi:L-lactate dehydrogenase complex protein LldE